MNFKSIFLPLILLPDFQSTSSDACFKSIVQFEGFLPGLPNRISQRSENCTRRREENNLDSVKLRGFPNAAARPGLGIETVP